MQDKRSQYRGYLITGLVIAFLLAFVLLRSVADSYAQEEYLISHLSINEVSDEDKKWPVKSTSSKVSQQYVHDIKVDHQLGDSNGIKETRNEPKFIKTLAPFQLDLRLAGTVLAGKEYTYALIVEEMTGRQNLYSVGESIRGAKVLKIGKESIVVEKDGRTYVLRITGGSYTEADSSEILTKEGPITIGVSEELPYFEPVFSETGPPVDENIHVKELPPFEPITNSTDPPVDPEGLYEDLQEFIPFENDSGPPGV
jgi:type II secretory pathway component PulC